MIILRKLGVQQSSDCRFVMADELVGLADGVNQTFAVSYEYTPGNIEILYNGQVLTSPEDFDEYNTTTISGLEPNEIRFIYLKPTDLTVLQANYQIGDCETETGSSGISAVSEDLSPELGGHLYVGNHLLMLDPNPNGLSSHGNQIGYSGDASAMYVADNAGVAFACPLYMKTNGQWAACTAVSGTTQMPCLALSLEEDEGANKKVFWQGNIKNSAWNFTPGQAIYVSTVEGEITKVKPTGDSWVQVIGRAISTDTFRFDPDLTSEDPNS